MVGKMQSRKHQWCCGGETLAYGVSSIHSPAAQAGMHMDISPSQDARKEANAQGLCTAVPGLPHLVPTLEEGTFLKPEC